MDLDDILMMLVGGTVIGILGKLAAPGDRDHVPLWLTVICGMGGIMAGTYLYVDILRYNATTPGVDWWRHIWQVGFAAVLVVVAAVLTGRRRA
jgi:uncharacterized membrane protein YeaQ/YmgE (transglycosylase-associated protein family)